MKILNIGRFIFNSDTKQELIDSNLVLMDGEIAIEQDTQLMKVGDGKTYYRDLPYLNRGEKGDRGDKGEKGATGETGAALSIKGSFDNVEELPAAGVAGDGYMVGGDLYLWSDTEWVNVGPIKGEKGDTGATFTPTVNVDGDISWANDKGLANPTIRNIRGPQGTQGPQGPAGDNATTTEVATEDSDGLMSSADKVKLDGLTNYTHPSTHPASMITQDTNNRFVSDTEKSTWNGKQNALTQGANITISGNTISAVDTVYTHPTSHPASMITESTTRRFVTDTEKSTWNSKASTDVATASANGLMSSTDKVKMDNIEVSGIKVYASTDTIPTLPNGVVALIYEV